MKALLGIFQVPELRKKLFVTLALLIVYRMGTFITMPGIDSGAVSQLFESFNDQAAGVGKMMGMVNMFSGGALKNASIFALGIMPYITASILFQILTTMLPALKQMQKDGESGRRKINQYTRYATLGLCTFQSFVICRGLEALENGALVPMPGFFFVLIGMISLTTGTIIVMWLGEMITEFGLGNGISIIIMAGILAELPSGIQAFAAQLNDGSGAVNYGTLAFLLAFYFAVTIAIVYTTLGQRRIPIRQNRRAGAASGTTARAQYLPLKVNMAGVIPIIFAQAMIMFPSIIASIPSLEVIGKYFQPGSVVYNVFYIGLIVFFCYFYTAMIFNPEEMSENMKQGGTFIPGIRPGVETQTYFENLLVKITTFGALVLAIIAVIPQFLTAQFQISFALAGIFGGTGLLIVVGVALDLIQKVEGHLYSRNFSAMLQSDRVGAGI